MAPNSHNTRGESPQQMEVNAPPPQCRGEPPPLKNVLSSFDDQYMAPNGKYTGGEWPHPPQMEVSASPTKCW